MDVARPYSGVSPTLEGDVLVALATTTRPLSGRQIARLARRGSQPAVNAALERLVVHGLVRRQEAPPAFLHTLNRDHVGFAAVEALADMRSELLRRLRAAFSGWGIPPFHASMFGSAARGGGDTSSDIDLFVVRPRRVDEGAAAWGEQLSGLGRAVTSWTGNRLSTIEFAEADLPRLRARQPPVAGELAKDAIELAGVPLAEILKASA